MQISTTWEQKPVANRWKCENRQMTQRYFYSSHDKKQDGTRFLRIGVTLAKLIMPSIKSLQGFYEMHLCIKFV